jgi:hypothetical protein
LVLDEFKVEGFVVEAVGGRVTVTVGRSGEGKGGWGAGEDRREKKREREEENRKLRYFGSCKKNK